MNILKIAVLVIILILIVTTIAGCNSSSDTKQGIDPRDLPPSAQVGRLAPDFTLTTVNGESITLSDYRGKTVFINFWATWCPPCKAEMPDIEALYQEHKGKEVVIIGISNREGADKIRRFANDNGYNWIFADDQSGTINLKYRVAALPTSYFIDNDGLISGINIGYMTKGDMESRLADARK